MKVDANAILELNQDMIGELLGHFFFALKDNSMKLNILVLKRSFHDALHDILQNNSINGAPSGSLYNGRKSRPNQVPKDYIACAGSDNPGENPCHSTLLDSFACSCDSCLKRFCLRHLALITQIEDEGEKIILAKPEQVNIHATLKIHGFCLSCAKEIAEKPEEKTWETIYERLLRNYDVIEMEWINTSRNIDMKRLRAFLNFKREGENISLEKLVSMYFNDPFCISIPSLWFSIISSQEYAGLPQPIPAFDAFKVGFYNKYFSLLGLVVRIRHAQVLFKDHDIRDVNAAIAKIHDEIKEIRHPYLELAELCLLTNTSASLAKHGSDTSQSWKGNPNYVIQTPLHNLAKSNHVYNHLMLYLRDIHPFIIERFLLSTDLKVQGGGMVGIKYVPFFQNELTDDWVFEKCRDETAFLGLASRFLRLMKNLSQWDNFHATNIAFKIVSDYFAVNPTKFITYFPFRYESDELVVGSIQKLTALLNEIYGDVCVVNLTHKISITLVKPTNEIDAERFKLLAYYYEFFGTISFDPAKPDVMFIEKRADTLHDDFIAKFLLQIDQDYPFEFAGLVSNLTTKKIPLITDKKLVNQQGIADKEIFKIFAERFPLLRQNSSQFLFAYLNSMFADIVCDGYLPAKMSEILFDSLYNLVSRFGEFHLRFLCLLNGLWEFYGSNSSLNNEIVKKYPDAFIFDVAGLASIKDIMLPPAESPQVSRSQIRHYFVPLMQVYCLLSQLESYRSYLEGIGEKKWIAQYVK